MKQTVFMEQKIVDCFSEIEKKVTINRLFIVCGKNCKRLQFINEIEKLPMDKVWFDAFEPNPKYESVVKGVKEFQDSQCDAILAIGGGSAMDVAKCIKLYATMDEKENFLQQEIKENTIPLLAIPTTAGTGSEATRFAVIYYEGEKQSVTHDSIVPEYVFLYPEILNHLSDYQKRATMMDAFCHAIESFWSVNSTKESKEYSKEAITLIMENMFLYLDGETEATKKILLAANIAGKAINITQTTAGHAMCYKLTSLYGISHGHAAILCVEKLWNYMIEHLEDCLDKRGKDYLQQTFLELAQLFGCASSEEACEKLHQIMVILELFVLEDKKEDIEILVHSVNETRLKNHPILLNEIAIRTLYQEILRG